jgi:hypothetical protein
VNPQVALSFPAAYVGREAWNRQLDVLRAAVKHLGLKEVAYELDVGGTQLADALNERDRKVWHGHWTHVVKAMLGARRDAMADELLLALVEADVIATPYAITQDVELTPEEENIALRRELGRFGEAGKVAAARVRKGRRK